MNDRDSSAIKAAEGAAEQEPGARAAPRAIDKTLRPPATGVDPGVALPAGFLLYGYRIELVLGQGPFGITYLARDTDLDVRVVIKEYLPEEIAFRSSDRGVTPNASRHRESYYGGLEAFLVEARRLASFRHPSIVRVARFFEANRTAYMVLDYEEGSSLRAWWPAHQSIGEKELVVLLVPLFDGLAVLHASGVLHRDIKPDNIQVRADDGRLVLLDFAFAAHATAAGGNAAPAPTPGYGAPEQYGAGAQGPWTDLYAIGATLYWAVSGRKPPDAQARAADPRAYRRAVEAGRGRYGEPFLRAIDWALSLHPNERPRDILELRHALFVDHQAGLGPTSALISGDTVFQGERPLPPRPRRLTLRALAAPSAWPLAAKLVLAALALALLPAGLLAGYAWRSGHEEALANESRFVEQAATDRAARIAQFVAASRHLARQLATDNDFVVFLITPASIDKVVLNDKVARIVKAQTDLLRFALVDAAGNAVLASDGQRGGASGFAAAPEFQAAMKGRASATDIAGSPGGLTFAEPVAGDDGQVLGVLLLSMRGDAVIAALGNGPAAGSTAGFLVDTAGTVVAHARSELVGQNLAAVAPALAPVMAAAKGAGHAGYVSAATAQPEFAGFAPVAASRWIVGVSEPGTALESALDSRVWQLLWIVPLLMVLIALLVSRFARAFTRPIDELTRAANALKAGDFNNATVPVQRKDELGELARTFNVMIDVLRQRERERRK